MIHLISVDHVVQYRSHLNSDMHHLIPEFQSIVRKVCSTKGINVLAEEFNRECCTRNNVETSVLEDLSSELGLIHCFIEADSEERKARNISSKDHDLREAIWLEKLAPYIESDVLVVCGQQHIKSFGAKLHDQDIPWEIAHDGIGIDTHSI